MPKRPNTWDITLWGRRVEAELLNPQMMMLSIPESLHEELQGKRLVIVTKGEAVAPFYLEGYGENGRIQYEARWAWGLTPEKSFSLMHGITSYATWKVGENEEVSLAWSQSML